MITMKSIYKHIYLSYNIFFTIFILLITTSCLTEDEQLEIKYKPVTVTTNSPTIVSYNSIVVGGNITAPQERNVQRGICWSTSPDKNLDQSYFKTTPEKGIGRFSTTISGLSASTKYYFKAFAKSSLSTVYGNEVSVTTSAAVLASVLTNPVTTISINSAICGGSITEDGGSSISSRGVCWSTLTGPTISNSKTTNGSGLGTFTSSISNLSAGTTYYVRAFATNSKGTAYGNEVSFRTQFDVPVISTNTVTSITSISAICGGNIISDGGSPVSSRGVCWSNSYMPTILNSKTNDGTGIGTFLSSLSGLSPNTTYYVRAYATNGVGTAYGSTQSFKTNAISLPILSTNTISSITISSAISGGIVAGDGGASVTAKGVCWSNTTTTPTISYSKTSDGSGLGSFTSSITGLLPNTTYYVRAYATNSAGTAYGGMQSFKTNSVSLPVINTYTIYSITASSAISGGSISSDGGASVTSKGVCWSSSTSSPTTSNSKTTNGTGSESFTSSITGLSPNTTYYVRAYATNNAGTAYGSQISFRTLNISLPSISTNSVSSITASNASSGGTITSDGGASIISKGVCWSSTTSYPTTSSSKTIDGSGTGLFTSLITGLSPNTTYYIRAYATNSAGTAYGSVRSFKTISIAIGQSYQGGIIFYVDGTGLHGLVCATTNQSAGIRWYNGSYITTGATISSIGHGNSNTNTIVSYQGSGSYAAKLCYDLSMNGYSDWYLPSKSELNLMYLNLKSAGLGDFSSADYWSSTENSSTSAYYQSFSSGSASTAIKSNIKYVRAVRSF